MDVSYCLHPQGRRINQVRNKPEGSCKEMFSFTFLSLYYNGEKRYALWLEGWVGPKVDLASVKCKKYIYCSGREAKQTLLPVAQVLYRLG
jgi:hypothetical protein